MESLDEALSVGESSNQEEFRQLTEQFLPKSLECMKEVTEARSKQNQAAMNKLTECLPSAGRNPVELQETNGH